MRGIFWRWSVLGLVTALAACDASLQESATAACTALCSCQASPLPNQQEECLGECLSEVPASVPLACLDCISAHANRCSTLEIECEPICDRGQDDNPPPPPPMIVDAFVADPEPKEGP
jgi:hypothetical protein